MCAGSAEYVVRLDLLVGVYVIADITQVPQNQLVGVVVHDIVVENVRLQRRYVPVIARVCRRENRTTAGEKAASRQIDAESPVRAVHVCRPVLCAAPR